MLRGGVRGGFRTLIRCRTWFVSTGSDLWHISGFGCPLSTEDLHRRTSMNYAFIGGFFIALIAVMVFLLIRLWAKDKLER